MLSKRAFMLLSLSLAALTAVGGAAAAKFGPLGKHETAAWVKDADLPAYGAQKVIYHVDFSGGLFDRRYKHVLTVAQNHVDASTPGGLDLRVVMQGDGADLLVYAKNDLQARATIDRLKAAGVKFELCRNTLIQRGLDPDRDLYGVAHEDVVRAAVGEIAALEAQGFRYIKPGD